jgi:hypothetical protein
MRRPSGASAPATALAGDGSVIDLEPLAREICTRFWLRFGDQLDPAHADGEWCRHDNQYLLAWAIQEARDGTVSLVDQTAWLVRVLDARSFPIALLAEDLEIAADVVRERHDLGELGSTSSEALATASAAVHAMAAHTRARHPPQA